MSNHVYFQAAGLAFGPFTPEQIRLLTAEGTIKSSTLLRRGEAGDWVAAGTVRGLFPAELANATNSQSQAMPETPATLVANRQSMKPLPGWNERTEQQAEPRPEPPQQENGPKQWQEWIDQEKLNQLKSKNTWHGRGIRGGGGGRKCTTVTLICIVLALLVPLWPISAPLFLFLAWRSTKS